jgi:hypothetical protein
LEELDAPSGDCTSLPSELFDFSKQFSSTFFLVFLSAKRIRIRIVADKATPPITLPTMVATLFMLPLFELANAEVEFPRLLSANETEAVAGHSDVKNRGITGVVPFGSVVVIDIPVSCVPF